MAKKQEKDKSSDSPEKTESSPWAHAHPRVTINFSTKFLEELHMKMTWLTENVPKLSIQKIVQDGTAAYVEKLLRNHYKP